MNRLKAIIPNKPFTNILHFNNVFKKSLGLNFLQQQNITLQKYIIIVVFDTKDQPLRRSNFTRLYDHTPRNEKFMNIAQRQVKINKKQ